MNAVPSSSSAAEQRSARLKITEIFYSLQGESRTVGWPTVFVRLTGCPLRCVYCDSEYAFYGGEWKTIDEIVARVGEFAPRFVTVTGGEPLAQKNCLPLLTALCDANYEVSLETSGAIDITPVDPRVIKVMDLKTPGSGEEKRNRWENLVHLTKTDQIKFVITSREDYDWARAALLDHALDATCEVLFSPAFGQQGAEQLAGWILSDRLNVRFQLQLHKVLWGDTPGR